MGLRLSAPRCSSTGTWVGKGHPGFGLCSLILRDWGLEQLEVLQEGRATLTWVGQIIVRSLGIKLGGVGNKPPG